MRTLALRTSARTTAYVLGVVALSAYLGYLAITYVPSHHQIPLAYAIASMVMIGLAHRLQIRYHYWQHVEALTLVETVFAPVIFRGSGLQVVLVVGVGLVLGSTTSSRRKVIKLLFNTAQWVTAASVGSLAFHVSDTMGSSPSAAALALVGAMVAVWVTNQVLISGLFTVTEGNALGSEDNRVVWTVLLGRCASFAASTILGLLMTAAYLWVPWIAPLVLAPLVFLWSAGRAEVSVRADRRLLDGLQRATHDLATSLDPAVALPPSLAAARLGFEVREVQLVVVAERGFPTIYRSVDRPSGGFAVETAPHGLAELLVDTLVEPARLGPSSGSAADALARMGYFRAIAAPLRSGSTTVGVLLLLDREGAEGFERGELSIAGAFARELVGFLERMELVGAIDDERRKLNDIVEHTGDGIVSLDEKGTILSWNAAMASITGYSADEMIDTRHFGLLRPRDAQDEDIHVLRWSEGAPGLLSEIQIVTITGTTVWLSCSYSRVPSKDGGPEVLVIVARNVTKARELELLKDDFIAVVSHELRTPLVPIKGWAQTLLNRGDRLTLEQQTSAIQSILTQAQRLEALILNILESSRLEAGQSEIVDTVDVVAVAVHVVEDVLAARPDRVIRVRPPQVPCEVRGSTVWVDRALANLVANAVKYSPDDAPVDVVVSAIGAEVSVAVTDRGPGIAADSLERIFERFERLEGSSKQTGTGLGLYITRRLARAMGGDVTVSSLPGAGSTFVLTLPAYIAPSATDLAPLQRAISDASAQRA